MLERIGADAVGMSTVAEAVEAFRVGMKVLGISCIANARERKDRLTHDEVERTVRNVVPVLAPLIAAIVSRI
jgi:purine-nucleoside phosphorylase